MLGNCENKPPGSDFRATVARVPKRGAGPTKKSGGSYQPDERLGEPRVLTAPMSAPSSFTVLSETLWRPSKTELSHLTQLPMINGRLIARTALAEQEQHYSSPTT